MKYMMRYTEVVPYELAEEINELGLCKDCGGIYVGDGADDSILFTNRFCMVGWYTDRKFIPAPTFAEVFDALSEKGVFITLCPNTFKQDDFISNVYEEVDGKLYLVYYIGTGTWDWATNESIRRGIQMLKERKTNSFHLL